jgi:hypothetical protein
MPPAGGYEAVQYKVRGRLFFRWYRQGGSGEGRGRRNRRVREAIEEASQEAIEETIAGEQLRPGQKRGIPSIGPGPTAFEFHPNLKPPRHHDQTGNKLTSHPQRNLPTKGFRPATLLGIAGLIMGYGWYRVIKGIRERKYVFRFLHSHLSSANNAQRARPREDVGTHPSHSPPASRRRPRSRPSTSRRSSAREGVAGREL